MIKNIEISPEMARLVQRQCRREQLPFAQQLARGVVEEAIMSENPQLDLLVDSASALAEIPALVRAAGVNDVVINGKHVHVAVLDSDNKVAIPAMLARTRYLANGALIVKLDGTQAASVVGHLSAAVIDKAFESAHDTDLFLEIEPGSDFELAKVAETLMAFEDGSAQMKLKAQDYVTFVNDRSSLPLAVQRQIVSALMEPAIRENVSFLWQRDHVVEALADAALWNSRVDALCQKLALKFTSLAGSQIKDAVLRVGEKLGGQVEITEFQKTLVGELTQAAIRERVSPKAQAQIKGLIDEIYSGASALKAVKQLISNQLTIDLAEAITRQRKGIIDLANATADEFGLAFRSLSLQPAYATHSQKETVSLEVVDEALLLLEVAKLAEEMKGLEF
jgi:hypothetical protein